jgi:hypothetical protein
MSKNCNGSVIERIPLSREFHLVLIFLTMIIVSFEAEIAYSSITQNTEQGDLYKRDNHVDISTTLKISGNGGKPETDEAAEARKYLLNAGRNLETAAGLRYAGLGLGTGGLMLSRYGDEGNSDLSRILSYGSVILLASPYYVGEAGRQLTRADLGYQIRESGTALLKYRLNYYGGFVASILGTGLLVQEIYKGSGSKNPDLISAGVTLALGGLLYNTVAPPHYLGTAGSSLSKAELPFMDANLQVHEAGLHLMEARGLQYSSMIPCLAGIAVVAYGLSNSNESDDESAILTGVGALGISILVNLVADIRIGVAGMRLDQASGMIGSSR